MNETITPTPPRCSGSLRNIRLMVECYRGYSATPIGQGAVPWAGFRRCVPQIGDANGPLPPFHFAEEDLAE